MLRGVRVLGVCMRRFCALRTPAGRRKVVMSCILLLTMNGSLVAQTTGTANPQSAMDPPQKDDEPPPGGCMPIGITASGEIVFPLQCRDFIERLKAADRKPAVSGENHSAAPGEPVVGQVPVATEQVPEEKTAANKEENLAPENSRPGGRPATKPQLENSNEREQAAGPPGCTRFRSYDPASGTYRSYDGRRLSCRVVDRAAMAK
jgi:BA14K-like protein